MCCSVLCCFLRPQKLCDYAAVPATWRMMIEILPTQIALPARFAKSDAVPSSVVQSLHRAPSACVVKPRNLGKVRQALGADQLCKRQVGSGT